MTIVFNFNLFGLGPKYVKSSGGRVLGGGITGYVPQGLITTDNFDEFAQTRFLLKQAWNTNYARQLDYNKSICTPFRAVNNAGDILSRQNYSCGGSCQTFQSRPRLHGLKQKFGHIQDNCDGTAAPAAACNVKWVYDSSDYSRYLKQKAINKNYNDISYGGDQSSASQSQWRAIRRY